MALPKEYDDLPGTVVFDADQAREGYHLNMFCMSLMKDENRKAFKADEAEVRYESAESALFGTPDEIMRKLEALRQGGVEYVIINFGGSRENIRRFARDIMPAFAGEQSAAAE